ncbi:Pentatricopeptide repeat-containing protein [Artemisia annua]|uniref:Pentatricopeptide repeat-containing protein n=1 Tax=Artemisia annua TaxID=35608 RepID=A0A2U1NWD9_ARTAN|nr:Pentatricopeptide repeat-containing protein [Artemisia annua]
MLESLQQPSTEDALYLFLRMSENQINNLVYNILIDGTRKCGPDNTKNLSNEGTIKRLRHDVYTYNAMIRCFCEDSLPNDAKQLFMKMKETGCSPNNATYNVLLHAWIKEQTI